MSAEFVGATALAANHFCAGIAGGKPRLRGLENPPLQDCDSIAATPQLPRPTVCGFNGGRQCAPLQLDRSPSLRLYRNKQDIVGAGVLDRPATQRVASPDGRQSACGRGRDAEDVVSYKIEGKK